MVFIICLEVYRSVGKRPHTDHLLECTGPPCLPPSIYSKKGLMLLQLCTAADNKLAKCCGQLQQATTARFTEHCRLLIYTESPDILYAHPQKYARLISSCCTRAFITQSTPTLFTSKGVTRQLNTAISTAHEWH